MNNTIGDDGFVSSGGGTGLAVLCDSTFTGTTTIENLVAENVTLMSGSIQSQDITGASAIWLPTSLAAAANSGSFAVTGSLYSVLVTNSSTGSFYFQVFDSGSIPPDGASPRIAPLAVPAGETRSLSFDRAAPLVFSLGIVWAASSTAATKTETTSAACTVSAEVL